MKQTKGITMIMLVITIVVLLIIASVSVSVGGNLIKRANLQTLNTNMLLLQAKVKTIAEEAKFQKDTTTLKGRKVSDVTDNAKITQLIQEGIIENPEQYYFISQQELNEMGLEKVQQEEGYVVNYETEEIIYVKGFEANNTTYYKLSETKEMKVE